MQENSQCQLPFDGANTNGYQLLYLPGDGSTGLNSPGVMDFTIGEAVDYDYDLYEYDWYGRCQFKEYRSGQETDERGRQERDISGRLKEVSTLAPRYPGRACAINMYFYSGTARRDCGRNCDEEREFSVYLFTGGQQFFKSTMKRIGNAIDQWIGLNLILFAAIAN